MDSRFDHEIKIPPLKRKKTRQLSSAGIVALIAFFLLCFSFGFWLAGMFTNPIFPEDKEENPDTVYKSRDILNVLVMGVDQRENEPARSDTLVLACLDLDKKKVNLLSLPRDTRVDIPGKGVKRKINYAHAVGGAELAIKTVENFLKLPVHYYVETNFDGFSNAIDILGGITLNVEEEMYFPEEGIDLDPGLQKLDGHDALSYVRWRGDGRGDIGRIERQQKFIQALSDQAMRLSTVWKLPQLIGELNKQVKTDMDLQKMIMLANKFRDFQELEVNTYMVPGVPDDVNYGGSYWIADEKELHKILEKIYDLNQG
ncbi:MAG: LCP family protein [Peptococcia bacterium]|jgi:LCP family protein required for cell wall assembly